MTSLALPGSRRPRLLILAYHAIADLRDDSVLAEYAVPPDRFAEQLDMLAARGWTFVDLDAVLRVLDGEAPPPRRAVLVTFDDAYADLLGAALPLLAERRIPAIAFAVAGRIGATNTWDSRKGAATLELLDAEGLRTVAARGIEIGSHATTHRGLPSVPAGELDDELAGSAMRLEALGLPPPRSFSYPYGRWDPRLAAAVREAGYEAAFTVDWGRVGAGSDRCSLPRIEVHAGDTPRKLRLKLLAAGWPALVRDLFLWLMRVRLDPSAR